MLRYPAILLAGWLMIESLNPQHLGHVNGFLEKPVYEDEGGGCVGAWYGQEGL